MIRKKKLLLLPVFKPWIIQSVAYSVYLPRSPGSCFECGLSVNQQCTIMNWIVSIPLYTYDKFYWIKPSFHNTIDSCYSTSGHISHMFRLYLAIIRLTKVSINCINVTPIFSSTNYVYPIGTTTLCTLINTNLCKPDDCQIRPKHVADVTSCGITTVNCVV